MISDLGLRIFVIPKNEGSTLFVLDLSVSKVDPSFFGMTKNLQIPNYV